MRFTIKNDWVTEVSGGPENVAKEVWDEMKSVENAHHLSEIGFGVNKYETGRDCSRRMGTMHFGFGDSIRYGGRIPCRILRIHMLYSPMIEVNGKVIVENQQFPLFKRSEK